MLPDVLCGKILVFTLDSKILVFKSCAPDYTLFKTTKIPSVKV